MTYFHAVVGVRLVSKKLFLVSKHQQPIRVNLSDELEMFFLFYVP